MRAVVAPDPGGPEALQVTDLDDLEAGPGELLVAVASTSVNRADILQREGKYPPPTGASEVLGLEAAGVVTAVGAGVDGWAVGDGVCAVLPGGGYAEQAVIPAAVAMPLPPGIPAAEAGCIPEVFATAYDNVFLRAGLSSGETVLVHGGASGVGTATIQLAKREGCRVLVSAGAAERVAACQELGADGGVVYRDENWAEQVLEATQGRGVDVVLDMVGGPYLRPNLQCLTTEGRLVVIGLQGGAKAELNLGVILGKRLAVMGSTLRARTNEEKAPLMHRLVTEVWPGFADGSLRPIIGRRFALDQAAEAHRALDSGEVVGKVLLTT